MQNVPHAPLVEWASGRTIWGMRGQAQFAWRETRSKSAAIAALAWTTMVADAVLMITLTWRWAFRDEPFSTLGAVTLSALMLGFLGAAATVVKSLGHPAQSRAETNAEEPDALLLFPPEDSSVDDLLVAPHVLATHRKALL
jgi:hypothetical protein